MVQFLAGLANLKIYCAKLLVAFRLRLCCHNVPRNGQYGERKLGEEPLLLFRCCIRPEGDNEII
jgi:hypothetical protein